MKKQWVRCSKDVGLFRVLNGLKTLETKMFKTKFGTFPVVTKCKVVMVCWNCQTPAEQEGYRAMVKFHDLLRRHLNSQNFELDQDQEGEEWKNG